MITRYSLICEYNAFGEPQADMIETPHGQYVDYNDYHYTVENLVWWLKQAMDKERYSEEHIKRLTEGHI